MGRCKLCSLAIPPEELVSDEVAAVIGKPNINDICLVCLLYRDHDEHRNYDITRDGRDDIFEFEGM